MKSIWKRLFIILIQHKACTNQFLREIAEQGTGFVKLDYKKVVLNSSIYNAQNHLYYEHFSGLSNERKGFIEMFMYSTVM